MAKFKCKQSGNVFEFMLEHDIKAMRKHAEYTEIIEKAETEKQEPEKRSYKSKVK
jgi:hypothetical protein